MSLDATRARPADMPALARKMKSLGHRLVTMTCLEADPEESGDGFEIIYHFDRHLALTHYRVFVPRNEPCPSISGVYFCAFLVENEIIDQYGVRFTDLVLDFGGTLYLEEEAGRTPFCKYSVNRKQD
jgi:ech hydrogenase subunit D